jgi:2-hydroxycyclohexanecarboxyl-CoA dehydrogenase
MAVSLPSAERVVVVTGAASGIGRATASTLRSAGFGVVGADLAPAEDVVELDVTDAAAAARLAGEVGPVWAVVNCAGWDETMRFLETEPGFWQRVLAVNLLGVVAVTHAFLGAMVEAGHGGRVVNVASDAGRVGSSGETVYAGAKGGVIAFTKSVAREMARHAITANAVCPGPTDTPMFRAQPEKLQGALERAIPLRRVARPEEVAHAIAFFCGDEAGYITGQVLSVSGGLTMSG